MSLPTIEIIVGTYSEYLLGYQLIRQRDESRVQLKQTFADKSHAGSIKCLAAQGKWVASGGIDDRIFIYDMERRKQAHILTNHTGTINTLVFASDTTHLLSGGGDGHMIATRVGSWRIEGNWPKAHNRKSVNLLACHPSNRLALSLGADLVLNTWNLIKGRVAYRTNLRSKRELGTAPDCLSWSTSGEHFTLSGPLAVAIFQISSASIVRHIKLPAKPICVAWLDASNCLAGLENGSIAWISLEEGEGDKDQHPHIIAAHEQRVKAMSCLQDTLVTISSSGELKVWQFPNVADKKLQLLAEARIDCRPTCLALLDLQQCGNQQQQQHDKQLPQSRLESRQPKGQQPAMQSTATRRGFVSIEFDQQAEDDEENSEDSPDSDKKEAESDEDEAESDEEEAESDEDASEEDSDEEEEHKRQVQKPQRVANKDVANRKRPAPLKSVQKSKMSKKSKTNK